MVEEIQRQRTVFPTEDREYFTPPTAEYWGDDVSFPTQEQADRWEYGSGAHMNRPGANTGPWQYEEDYFNPDVFARQMDHSGLGSWTEGARKFAELSNEGFYPAHFESPGQARNLLNWVNSNTMMGPALDELYPEYRDLYDLDFDTMFAPQMYKSKREQIEDEENTFVANLMENYGRDNPLLQELGGMETTEVTSPRGDVTTTEEYIDDGYNLRDLGDIRYGYGSNLDPNLALPPSNIGYDRGGPMGVPSNIGYDRAGGTGVPSNIGYDRAGPRGPAYPPNIGFDRAGADPALPPSDLGFARAGAELALPPSNIGFARAGADPALPPSDIGYDRAGRGERWWDKIPSWLWPLLGAGQGVKGIETLLGNR